MLLLSHALILKKRRAHTTLTSSSPDLLIPHVIIQQRRNINEVLNVAHVHGGDVDDPRERGRSTRCDSTAIIKILQRTPPRFENLMLLLGGHFPSFYDPDSCGCKSTPQNRM